MILILLWIVFLFQWLTHSIIYLNSHLSNVLSVNPLTIFNKIPIPVLPEWIYIIISAKFLKLFRIIVPFVNPIISSVLIELTVSHLLLWLRDKDIFILVRKWMNVTLMLDWMVSIPIWNKFSLVINVREMLTFHLLLFLEEFLLIKLLK